MGSHRSPRLSLTQLTGPTNVKSAISWTMTAMPAADNSRYVAVRSILAGHPGWGSRPGCVNTLFRVKYHTAIAAANTPSMDAPTASERILIRTREKLGRARAFRSACLTCWWDGGSSMENWLSMWGPWW
jgi:hypothetical protein